MAELERLVGSAVRMMDNAIDVSRFPAAAAAGRGQGQAPHRAGGDGLGRRADLLQGPIRLAAEHRTDPRLAGGDQPRRLSRQRGTAREKGAFPLFDRDAYLARPHIQALPSDIFQGIAQYGIRNALLTSIAPTGTISLLAGNVSSGIEPVFAYQYNRKILLPDGSRREEQVEDHAVRQFRARFGDAALPIISSMPRRSNPPTIWRCRPRPSPSLTAPSPRPSTSRPPFPSTPSSRSMSRPIATAARAAPPTGPMTSPARCCPWKNPRSRRPRRRRQKRGAELST